MSDLYVPITLPSKCLTYTGVDPQGISIRPMKGRDEEILAELSLENIKKKLLTLYQGLIKGIDPKLLTAGDELYIMYWQAINSYSKDFPMSMKCPTCLRNIDISIDLNKLEVKELPNDFTQPVKRVLSTGPVSLRLQTIQDEINALDFGSKSKSNYLYNYALCIVDDNIDVIGRLKILEEMKTQDLAVIRKFHTDFAHGPILQSPYTCPKCEDEGEVSVPFRLDRFLSPVPQPGNNT